MKKILTTASIFYLCSSFASHDSGIEHSLSNIFTVEVSSKKDCELKASPLIKINQAANVMSYIKCGVYNNKYSLIINYFSNALEKKGNLDHQYICRKDNGDYQDFDYVKDYLEVLGIEDYRMEFHIGTPAPPCLANPRRLKDYSSGFTISWSN